MKPTWQELRESLLRGELRGLAKSLSLVESRRKDHRQSALKLLESLHPARKKAFRIGITGAPGVGKSTFIESFGPLFLAAGHRLAIMAIDPSSPRSFGSILGDKTRMETLAVHPHCFIRPSPSGLSLGGVARRTRECIALCEAAGYDVIFVETVGVGQSETVVASMVDLFVFLQLPHAGDQLQGIKKGILELSDFVVITKADGEFAQAAQRAKVDHELALHYLQLEKDRLPPQVFLSSALQKKGLLEIYNALLQARDSLEQQGSLERKRMLQREQWFMAELQEKITDFFLEEQTSQELFAATKQEVILGHRSPSSAVDLLWERFLQAKSSGARRRKWRLRSSQGILPK